MPLLLNLFRVTAFFSFLSFCFLGLFVYSRDRNSSVHRLFCAFMVTVGLWSLGFFLTMFPQIPPETAILFSRLSHLSGGLSPLIYVHFAISYLGLGGRLRIHPANYLLTGFVCVMCLSPWMIKALPPKLFFPYYPEPGPLYPIYIANYLGTFLRSLILLYKGSKQVSIDAIRRKQVWLAFVSVLTAWLGVTTLFLLIYNIRITPATPAYALLPAISIMFTYSILRYQFLDIEVIIKRTLVFAGLVAAVVAVVSVAAFVSQDVLAHFVQIPRWLSSVFAAMIIAAVYGPLRNYLTNVTERYLFQKKYDYKELLKKFTDELVVGIKDLKQLVQTTVQTLSEIVKLESCSLLLLNKDTRKYELVAAKGTNGRQIELDEQEQFITFLRETHEPIGKDGQLGKVRFPEIVTERLEQLNARLCLPLIVHDDLLGVLCLGKKKSDEEFTKDDLDILLPLAGTAAISVNNALALDELAKTQAEAAQKEKLAVIGTLSAGINHEICNPLGIVKAQCEAFLLDVEDGILIGKTSQDLLDRTTNIMRGALKQIDRATAITQKLSNFAKPIKEPTMQPVSVSQEIEEVLLLVGHDLKLEKIEVIKELQTDVPTIAVDRRQFQEVLFNLIRNSAQAIKPPGTIWVRAHTDGESRVRIEIADTGSGIAPDKLSKIYDPFFTTKEPGKGTGLGLFIVRQIVERNKGRISVESEVGKGTTFFLDFPVARQIVSEPVPVRS